MSATETTELVTAVQQFLREQVLPELDGFKAYNTRVAANALGIVARELEMGAGLAVLDSQIAEHLGLKLQSDPVPQQIALALRNGTLQADHTIIAYLRKRTLLALAIDNPKYSGLKQAKARWGDSIGTGAQSGA